METSRVEDLKGAWVRMGDLKSSIVLFDDDGSCVEG